MPLSRSLSQNQATAAGAFKLVQPVIEFTLEHIAKRNAGHLRMSVLVNGEWHNLLTHDFGVRDDWEHDYEGHATGKEKISQRTGLTSREVQARFPELLEIGDTIYFGSVISPGGTVVSAFSGVEAYYDEMIAQFPLTAYLGLLEGELAFLKDENSGIYQYPG